MPADVPAGIAACLSLWLIDSSPPRLEEELVSELRNRLDLPLGDIVEAMRRCVNPKLSSRCTI